MAQKLTHSTINLLLHYKAAASDNSFPSHTYMFLSFHMVHTIYCSRMTASRSLKLLKKKFPFFKIVEEEVLRVKSILQMYETISGQAINLQISGICFSSNVKVDKQQQLKHQLGVHKDLSNEKYLGLLAFVGRSKKLIFNYLKDRI